MTATVANISTILKVRYKEGVAFEEEARRVLNNLSGLAARARAIAAGKGRMLQVAATSAIATALIPSALAGFATETLPSEVHVAQYLPNVVAQELRAGRAEVGFSSLPLDLPGLAVLRFYAADDVVALHEDDPLCRHEVVPLAAFAGRRLVTMLDPMRFQRRVALAMQAHDIRPGPVIDVGMMPALDLPGEQTPGQFGPTIRVAPDRCASVKNSPVSCTVTP